MLIVLYGRHQFKIVKLGHVFGGRQNPAVVTIPELVEKVRQAILPRTDVCMHVLSGLKNGCTSQHSLVNSKE
jgi:hypothetical protein